MKYAYELYYTFCRTECKLIDDRDIEWMCDESSKGV